MKKFTVILIIIGLGVAGYFLAFKKPRTVIFNNPSPSPANQASATPMQIFSPAFAAGQSIPAKYTCEGEGINPPLNFSDVPGETKSLALVVDDPDAPGGDWVHWLVWDINPSTTEIAAGKVPAEATEGTTSFGQTGYGGPCPPSGSAHHYHFKLYALDAKLNLPTRTAKADLESAINGRVISQAELVGTYKQNQ
jgi:Raf kinase inhibitor-like YbhB/YbcL family protein